MSLATAGLIGFLFIGGHQTYQGGIGMGYPFFMFALGCAGLMLYFKGQEKQKESEEQGKKPGQRRKK